MMNSIKSVVVISLVSLLGITTAQASPRIAVLNFELNDITSLPNTAAELQRTAEMAPLLQQALRQTGEGDVLLVDADLQHNANASFGYLFHFHDLAAQLGQKVGADWIIVGQHSKPSFLYSYLRAYLIEVKTQRTIGRYDIELKGTHKSVTQRGVNALARKIRLAIASNQKAFKS
ncbi:MAG: DUF2380 domain-containing protein [Gammaproteobacteria bacterium]